MQQDFQLEIMKLAQNNEQFRQDLVFKLTELATNTEADTGEDVEGSLMQ